MGWAGRGGLKYIFYLQSHHLMNFFLPFPFHLLRSSSPSSPPSSSFLSPPTPGVSSPGCSRQSVRPSACWPSLWSVWSLSWQGAKVGTCSVPPPTSGSHRVRGATQGAPSQRTGPLGLVCRAAAGQEQKLSLRLTCLRTESSTVSSLA